MIEDCILVYMAGPFKVSVLLMYNVCTCCENKFPYFHVQIWRKLILAASITIAILENSLYITDIALLRKHVEIAFPWDITLT
jgi:hypothetical protein